MKRTSLMRWYIPIYLTVLTLAVAAACISNQAITTAAEGQPVPGRTCVIIDAGHGGVDGGATSCTGVLESSINLQIALRLEDLMHLLGYDTKMIRTTDISVYTDGSTIAQKKISDLKERVRMINTVENGLLVSIHQNQFPDSRYSGAQVFYAKAPDSELLAKQLQTAFVGTLNPGSRRLAKKSQGIYLMENIQCTGILIECGFLSNPQEEALLRDPAYQKKLCSVIASNLCLYLDRQTVN